MKTRRFTWRHSRRWRSYASIFLLRDQCSVERSVHLLGRFHKICCNVANLRMINSQDHCQVRFIIGKGKLAPRPENTMPGLELCSEVLAVELAELIQPEMEMQLHVIYFYTDCKVGLGYIHNQIRMFYVYVSNWVECIRKLALWTLMRP